ncbi:MAG TPA: hypothetical protein VI168_10245 [Croceibacterium sp.]
MPRWYRLNLGQRAAAVVIALAVELLLLLALLSLGMVVDEPRKAQVTEVDLSAQDYAEPAPAEPQPQDNPPPPTVQSEPQTVESPVPVPEPVQTTPARIPLPTSPPAPPPPERPRPVPPADGPVYGPPDTGRAPSDDSVRVGTAPNGEPLYAAKWYREPGEEFRGFLSAASPGWGLMACRTIADFYVTDCVALGETPGSRLTRSMLAGSGVLRVRPPRLGGRSLVGSWVRIRIDYTVTRESR